MSTPQLVSGVANATSIAVGYGHACALTAANEIYCWGLDTHGQLGHGAGASYETTPMLVQLPPEPMWAEHTPHGCVAGFTGEPAARASCSQPGRLSRGAPRHTLWGSTRAAR